MLAYPKKEQIQLNELKDVQKLRRVMSGQFKQLESYVDASVTPAFGYPVFAFSPASSRDSGGDSKQYKKARANWKCISRSIVNESKVFPDKKNTIIENMKILKMKERREKRMYQSFFHNKAVDPLRNVIEEYGLDQNTYNSKERLSKVSRFSIRRSQINSARQSISDQQQNLVPILKNTNKRLNINMLNEGQRNSILKGITQLALENKKVPNQIVEESQITESSITSVQEQRLPSQRTMHVLNLKKLKKVPEPLKLPSTNRQTIFNEYIQQSKNQQIIKSASQSNFNSIDRNSERSLKKVVSATLLKVPRPPSISYTPLFVDNSERESIDQNKMQKIKIKQIRKLLKILKKQHSKSKLLLLQNSYKEQKADHLVKNPIFDFPKLLKIKKIHGNSNQQTQQNKSSKIRKESKV